MKSSVTTCLILMILGLTCCSSDANNTNFNAEEVSAIENTAKGTAEITGVTITGNENAYTFSVSIKSPDTGCNQYADWWEVIDLDGNLIYRRILAHSHVDEQPFTRSGGAVTISKSQMVYVRGHMNNAGFGDKIFKGSIEDGFAADNLNAEFAQELADMQPLPSGCAF